MNTCDVGIIRNRELKLQKEIPINVIFHRQWIFLNFKYSEHDNSSYYYSTLIITFNIPFIK